ncbi:MAG: PQQ-binding-like beta-propeller repeat protein [Nocardiopsaceae bacterium]|nr:PQQ-binding-like beta-propeller repeat protein [Nocardiopsaceae bacterium]
MANTCDSARIRATAVGVAAVLLLSACGGRGPAEPADASPRDDPPAPAPSVPAAAIPPTLEPDPLWQAPFSSAPKATTDGFVGPVLPDEEGGDLMFLGVDGDGTTRWSTPRNPSCTAFAVTRDADGRELLVLLDSDADPERGALATRVTAAAYEPREGTLMWGPVEVPGTMVGPGLVFAAVEHTVMSDQSGPRLALDPSTGGVAADEEADDRVFHEYQGTLLVRREGRLRAVDTGTGEELWNGRDLTPPESLGAASGDPTPEYGPRPVSDASGAVALEWSADHRDQTVYTINDLRTGEPIAELSGREEPRIVGTSTGEAAISGLSAEDGTGILLGVTGLGSAGTGPAWRANRSEATPEAVTGGVLYLSGGDTVRALDMETGADLGEGTWTTPTAATGDGTALLPVESKGPGEAFVALRNAGSARFYAR